MGAAAREVLALALGSLGDSQTADDLAERAIAMDDRVDAAYVSVEREVLELFALESPVAGDLRLLTALLHISLHLERVADMGVNIAKLTLLTRQLPKTDGILVRLDEMGEIALRMLDAVMDAFARRDLELARELQPMDDPLDRLNRGMLAEVMSSGADPRLLRWAIEMHLVSRLIERVGDHAVDIGEQVAFMVTGEFEEFTDASHDDRMTDTA